MHRILFLHVNIHGFAQELQPLDAQRLEVAAASAAAAAAARSGPAHAQMSSSQILSALTNNILYKQVGAILSRKWSLVFVNRRSQRPQSEPWGSHVLM